MTTFIIGLLLGGFLGAFIASKPFRDKVIKDTKKLLTQNKKQGAK